MSIRYLRSSAVWAFAGLYLFAGSSFADEWTDGYQYISYFAADGADELQVKIGSPVVNNHNPSACATTLANAVYVTDPSTMSAKLINSTLLMAVAAHKRIKLYITTGCLYGQARIVAVEVEP